MIVVDTHVIAYLYLTGEHSPQAEKALQKDVQWAAPVLWRSEFRNVLALYIRKEILSLEDAARIMDDAIALMQDGEYEVTSHQVLQLVAGSSCSAYDCEFVALAHDLQVPLVTVDKKILEQFPGDAISLDEFVKPAAIDD
jgi:predicted nucleic acid-binding protein